MSLPTHYGVMVFNPEKISAKRGSFFYVLCSAVSKYRGGFFYLTETNKNVSKAQPGYNLSAYFGSKFDFPEIEKKHQGVYTCSHAVNISSTNFYSAPSKSLQVVVEDN